MNLRERFPLLVRYPELVYLDSAATTQRVDSALEAESHYYRDLNANVHRGLYPLSESATEAFEAVREKVRLFLNARSTQEIIFTRGTTESLNLVAQGWGRQFLKEGDEVVLSIMEHHSNIVPWQLLAERTGALLKFCPITEEGLLDIKAMGDLITPKTKMVSLTGLSNVLGTIVPIQSIVKMARRVGAKVCIDAAQCAAHLPMDVRAMDVDFLAFSGHKLYGSTGAGVLYGKYEILEAMDPWMGGGEMIKEVYTDHSTWNDLPWKFEAGTPPIAQVIGMGAGIDFMREIGFERIEAHDRELGDYSFSQLSKIPFVTVFGPKNVDVHRGAISFGVKGIHGHDVAGILGQENVCVRAGYHCAMPLHERLGLPGTTRLSFGVYTTKADIDRAVLALRKVGDLFGLA